MTLVLFIVLFYFVLHVACPYLAFSKARCSVLDVGVGIIGVKITLYVPVDVFDRHELI